jgi:hypothetical protein
LNTTPNPGLRSQSGTRTVLRALGLVMAPAGVLLVIVGFARFAGVGGEDWSGDGAPPGFLMFAGGGLLGVIGFALLNAGFMGVAARYGAGETMPVVKDSAAYLTDGQGVLGVGRTVDDAAATPTGATAAAGPYCRSCGARNDSDATYCDGCGQRLA